MRVPSITKHQKKTRLFQFLIKSYVILACFPVILSADFASAGEITLAWDANNEPNLMGYNIYYDTSPGAPYLGTDADQGASPITVMIEDLDDPENPEYTITGLDDTEVHYFVVSAFDAEAQESVFSNEASTAEVTSADSTSNWAFDGSGGCFIGVTKNDGYAGKGAWAIILLLYPATIGLMRLKMYFQRQSPANYVLPILIRSWAIRPPKVSGEDG